MEHCIVRVYSLFFVLDCNSVRTLLMVHVGVSLISLVCMLRQDIPQYTDICVKWDCFNCLPCMV